jgi:glucokinase
LSLFCVLMGRFAGNLALNMGTFGGVYIAGGIVPRFQEFFIGSGFRVAFEDKGRFKSYLKDIPVFLITHEGRVCSVPAPICASRSASSYKQAACRTDRPWFSLDSVTMA